MLKLWNNKDTNLTTVSITHTLTRDEIEFIVAVYNTTQYNDLTPINDKNKLEAEIKKYVYTYGTVCVDYSDFIKIDKDLQQILSDAVVIVKKLMPELYK